MFLPEGQDPGEATFAGPSPRTRGGYDSRGLISYPLRVLDGLDAYVRPSEPGQEGASHSTELATPTTLVLNRIRSHLGKSWATFGCSPLREAAD